MCFIPTIQYLCILITFLRRSGPCPNSLYLAVRKQRTDILFLTLTLNLEIECKIRGQTTAQLFHELQKYCNSEQGLTQMRVCRREQQNSPGHFPHFTHKHTRKGICITAVMAQCVTEQFDLLALRCFMILNQFYFLPTCRPASSFVTKLIKMYFTKAHK